MNMPGKKEANKETGALGETIACTFLKKKGYTILERNYRTKQGEVDIVARKKNIIRFVEVKTVSRENAVSHGYRPEERVHTRKIAKIAHVALVYMEKKYTDLDYQIDVIGILLDKENKTAKCRLFEGVT